MTALTSLVTGATDGIGRQTALELLRRGMRLWVHGRTEAKARAAALELAAAVPKPELAPVWGDLSSLAQVRALAAQVQELDAPLDRLINNAGIFMHERALSADGHELTFAVNHLAPFLLTHLLLPALRRSAEARVINVSSVAHRRGRIRMDDLELAHDFEGYQAYANSKLMNVLFTHELARRLSGTAITVFALHPGVINTKLLRAGFGAMGSDVAEGARTSVYLATDPTVPRNNGGYASDGRPSECAALANDPALERALYEESARLTGVEPLPAD